MGQSAEHMREIGKGTQFSKDNQPKNYRKPSLITIMKKKLFETETSMRFKKVIEVDDEGIPTGRKVNVIIPMDSADAIMMKYIKMAGSNPTIMKDMIDRIDGKAVQTVKMVTDTGGTLEQLIAREKEYTDFITLHQSDEEPRDTDSGSQKELSTGKDQSD